MPSNAYRPSSSYPAALLARVVQADHVARALGALSAKAPKNDLWLLGRADEVRTLVEEILREWAAGVVDSSYACEAIAGYVGPVHVALHRRYGGYGASCCSPHLEPIARVGVRSAPAPARRMLESGVQTVFGVAEADVETSAQRKSAG